MKKNIGLILALYPTPVTVIGAMVEDKPTWNAGGACGDHWTPCKPHFINGAIKAQNKLSSNLVCEEMLSEVDVSGSVGGAK